jgi:hypothetical protein
VIVVARGLRLVPAGTWQALSQVVQWVVSASMSQFYSVVLPKLAKVPNHPSFPVHNNAECECQQTTTLAEECSEASKQHLTPPQRYLRSFPIEYASSHKEASSALLFVAGKRSKGWETSRGWAGPATGEWRFAPDGGPQMMAVSELHVFVSSEDSGKRVVWLHTSNV